MILSLNALFGKKGECFQFERNFDLKEKELLETVGITYNRNLFCKGRVISYGESLSLECSYKIELDKICDRCLEYYEDRLEGILKRTISKSLEDGLNYIKAIDGNVNLHDIICDELMIVVSSQSLCSEDCKGLCTNCGMNLNEKSCDCLIDDIDPRFRALLDL